MVVRRLGVGGVWAAALLAALAAAGPAGPLHQHHLTKRSFFDIQCKGVYDKSIYARLDRICDDCYNLFREPQLHSLCRKDCFTSDYFKGCLEALLMSDDVGEIQAWIKQLHGADPGNECFSSVYFTGCVEALLLTEEEDKFMQMVEFLGKKKKK